MKEDSKTEIKDLFTEFIKDFETAYNETDYYILYLRYLKIGLKIGQLATKTFGTPSALFEVSCMYISRLNETFYELTRTEPDEESEEKE